MDQQALLFQESLRVRAGIKMGGIEQGVQFLAASLIAFPRQRLKTVVGIGDQQVFDRNADVRELLHERKPHIPDAHIPIHLGRQDLDDRILEGGGMEKHLECHQDQQDQSQQHSKDPNEDAERKVAAFRHDGYSPIVLKKSLPLSSTRMKAGKSTTSIFQMASIPSSGYSTHSMLLIFSCARMAAGPPMEPR